MKRHLKWSIPLLVVAALAVAFFVYTGVYYRAEDTARAALESGGGVSVRRMDYGWLFDGPSEEDALIFYPGAKIEEIAYAPLLRRIAGQGMDACLVEMPFRLAIFGQGRADGVMAQHDYARWYIGGHSLGGAMAADYAAKRADRLDGVVLLAAYPTKPLDDGLLLVSIYGSEDGVLNREALSRGEQYAPARYEQYVIEGGNHANFGNYGPQRGDGEASLSAEEQQRQTAELILRSANAGES